MKFDRVKFAGLRVTRGLSQLELAVSLDVSRPTVSAWEQGLSEPKLCQINKAAAVLGVKPEDLITDNQQ